MNHFVNIAGRVLCETSVQGLLILIVALTASRLLRGSSAANRCLVWQTAAALMLLMPLLSVLLPPRLITASPLPHRISNAFADSVPIAEPPVSSFKARSNDVSDVDISASTAPADAAPVSGMPTPQQLSPTPATTPPQGMPIPDARKLLVVLWASIMAMLVIEAAVGQVRLRTLRRSCTAVEDGPITQIASAVCLRLGIRRHVTLLYKVHAMPMAWGWLAPVVLLPTEASEWPAARIEMVLLHELAHIRRGDWPMQRSGRLLCCFYWFHPLAWICLAGMKRFGEEACDDVVLSSGVNAPEYASQLLEVIRIMKLNVSPRRNQKSASVAMAQPAQIHNRLRTILEPARSRSGIKRSTLLAAAIATMCMAPLGALHVFAQSTSQAATQSSASGTSSYKHNEQSNSSSLTSAAKKSAAHNAASSEALAHRLKVQAALIAQQQHEIQMLRKQAEMAKTQAQSNAAIAARLKRQTAELDALNAQLSTQSPDSRRNAAKLRADALNSTRAELESAAAEMQHRQAELSDLKANLDIKKSQYKAGITSSADLTAAEATIERATADLLKRQGELTSKARESAVGALDMQQMNAQIEAALESLKKARAQHGAGAATKAAFDAAQAEVEQAKAELLKAREEVDNAKAQAQAADKVARDAAQKNPR